MSIVDWQLVASDLERQVAALKAELTTMEQLYGTEFNLNNKLIAVRAALTKERDEAVSAVQRLREGQPFDQVVAADIVRRGMEQLAAMQRANDHQHSLIETAQDQLAASQAREQRLRDAMVIALGHYSMRTNAASVLENALALLQDDTALQVRLKEERERCAVECEQHGPTIGRIFASKIRSMK